MGKHDFYSGVGIVLWVFGAAIAMLASARSIEWIQRKKGLSRKRKVLWSAIAIVPVVGPLMCRYRLKRRTRRPGNDIWLRPFNGSGHDPREAFLADQQKHAESKVNHIDSLRQRNMVVSLAVFGVLLGFILAPGANDNRPVYATFLGLLMAAFCLLDRSLHRFSHGWRATGWAFRDQVTRIIDDPTRSVSLRHYLSSAERRAEFFSLIPVIYYLLIIGAIAVALVLKGGWLRARSATLLNWEVNIPVAVSGSVSETTPSQHPCRDSPTGKPCSPISKNVPPVSEPA